MQNPDPILEEAVPVQHATEFITRMTPEDAPNEPQVESSNPNDPTATLEKTQDIMERAMSAMKGYTDNNGVPLSGRQLRRKEARDKIKFDKKRAKKISRLNPETRTALLSIKELVKECKTHGELFFLNMCDEVILNLDEYGRDEICCCIEELKNRGLHLVDTEKYKTIFNKYNQAVKRLQSK